MVVQQWWAVSNRLHVFLHFEGQSPVLQQWPNTVMNLLANGNAAFKWKLHYHWLEGVQQQQITVVIQDSSTHNNTSFGNPKADHYGYEGWVIRKALSGDFPHACGLCGQSAVWTGLCWSSGHSLYLICAILFDFINHGDISLKLPWLCTSKNHENVTLMRIIIHCYQYIFHFIIDQTIF